MFANTTTIRCNFEIKQAEDVIWIQRELFILLPFVLGEIFYGVVSYVLVGVRRVMEVWRFI